VTSRYEKQKVQVEADVRVLTCDGCGEVLTCEATSLECSGSAVWTVRGSKRPPGWSCLTLYEGESRDFCLPCTRGLLTVIRKGFVGILNQEEALALERSREAK
jgi:hypothetical protein